ncbi:MAG: ATP-dependent DNA ligase [Cyclobacteriaceae bacterium]
MKQFASLILNLENTSSTTKKISFLKSYFENASHEDQLWTIALFSHKRPKRQINTKLLRKWACELSNIPEWLFEESYSIVGDLAESIALILPEALSTEQHSLSYWVSYLQTLQDLEEADKKVKVENAWSLLTKQERFVFNKLVTGGFRVGVSKNLMTKALAQSLEMEATQVAHLIMGDWTPDSTTFEELLQAQDATKNISKPYPFYLAYPLEGEVATLGNPEEWCAEWKWDGIRTQIIKRQGEAFIWSRGEELITEKFPELEALLDRLPNGTAIDGELLPFKNIPLPFSLLQTRIGRKTVTKKQLEQSPVVIYAYDLIELDGADLRHQAFSDRREKLKTLIDNIQSEQLFLSASIKFDFWTDLIKLREDSRAQYAEGLMLKRKNAPYKIGRKRGDWWKWKVDPFTIDAIMVYAKKGHGRRADLYSDFTFAVWEGKELITFAKAYSGLTDKELSEITKFVKANIKEKFGPVRTVEPSQVFEIHFEGISESKRHKAGIAVRFPRIHRWRKDKKPEDANTLSDLKSLLNALGNVDSSSST